MAATTTTNHAGMLKDKIDRNRQSIRTTTFTPFIVVFLLFTCTFPSRTTATTGAATRIHTAELNPDSSSSSDSVVNKIPERFNKSGIVDTWDKR